VTDLLHEVGVHDDEQAEERDGAGEVEVLEREADPRREQLGQRPRQARVHPQERLLRIHPPAAAAAAATPAPRRRRPPPNPKQGLPLPSPRGKEASNRLGIGIIRDWKPQWIDGELPAGRPRIWCWGNLLAGFGI